MCMNNPLQIGLISGFLDVEIHTHSHTQRSHGRFAACFVCLLVVICKQRAGVMNKNRYFNLLLNKCLISGSPPEGVRATR